MQQHHPPAAQVANSEIYDAKSQRYISVADGYIWCKDKEGKRHEQWAIPSQHQHQDTPTHRQYLKFIRTPNAHVSINPTGTLLICKSERIQEVEMNRTILGCETLYWSILVPHSLLNLTVGVKSKKSNKHQTFDFCLKYSSKLTFKVNLDTLSFKCWINDISSETKKPILLEKGQEWTPFIRIKENGSSLALNPFISDPERIISKFNIFQQHYSAEVLPQTEIKVHQISPSFNLNKNFNTIHLLNADTIAIQSQTETKIFKREENQKYFNFESYQVSKSEEQKGEDKLVVGLTQKEYEFLTSEIRHILGCEQLIDEVYDCKESKQYWMSKTKRQWLRWSQLVFTYLDRLYTKNVDNFGSTIEQIYAIFLKKLQSLRSILGNQLQISYAFALDASLISKVHQLAGQHQPDPHFIVPKSISFNATSYFNFNHPIRRIKATSKYIVYSFDANRISILNASYTSFKLGDFILSKGIKKEHEISQYKKQAEQINSNDFSQPSIYKILKNCLKYADKIKPPEKLVKQIENKKLKALEEKKPALLATTTLMPDKQLENTLITMGFNSRAVKKALVECKNASLEAAMDLILTKYAGQLPDEAPKYTPKSDWTCQICTYVNVRSALVCSICQSPALLIEEPVEEKKEQKKQQFKVEIVQDVGSEAINEELVDFYVWQTSICYCPLLVVGVFKTKMRVRLYGSNPKYFGTLYEKGEGFMDLSTMNVVDGANLIKESNMTEQSIYSSVQQLKEKHFGWIPIEDFDYPIDQTFKIETLIFQTLPFKHSSLTQEYTLKILRTNQQQEYSLENLTAKILLNKVYQEKTKCLSIIKTETFLLNEEELKIINKDASPAQVLNGIYKVENTGGVSISTECSEGRFEIVLHQNGNKSWNDYVMPETIVVPAGQQLLPNLNKNNLLSLYVKKGSLGGYNAISHSSNNICLYSPWKQSFATNPEIHHGLILSHLQHKQMEIEYVQLERTLKGIQSKSAITGYLYLSNDFRLKPVQMYAFTFAHDNDVKKIVIPIRKTAAKYLIIVLRPDENDKISQISNISAYGSITEDTSLSVVTQQKLLQIKLALERQQPQQQYVLLEANQFKQDLKIMNCPFDLSILQDDFRSQILNQVADLHNDVAIDFALKLTVPTSTLEKYHTLKSTNKICLHINSEKLKPFSLLNAVASEHYHQQSNNEEVLRAEYLSAITSYFNSENNYSREYLEVMLSDKYISFRECIFEQKIHIRQYLVKFISSFSNQRKQERAVLEIFFKNFSKIFKRLVTKEELSTFFDEIVLKREDLTATGLQLLFEFSKSVHKFNNSTLFELLQRSVKQISENHKKSKETYNFYAQKSIFSGYYHEKLTNHSKYLEQAGRLSSLNKIGSRYVLQKNKFMRRYTIDLISAYSISEINLLFDRSETKNRMKVVVSSVDLNTKQLVQNHHFFYDYPVWAQLTKCSADGPKSLQKQPITHFHGVLALDFQGKKIRSRYIVIDILFTLQSFNGCKTQIQNLPDNEIIPEIHGQYIGEFELHQCSIQEKLNISNEKLSFVKKVSNSMSKYSIKSANTSRFLYDEEERNNFIKPHQEKNISFEEILKRIDLPEYRDIFVRQLMKKPTRNNINFHFTLSCMLFENLIENNTFSELKQGNHLSALALNSDLLHLIIENCINKERGVIQQRAISFLKHALLLSSRQPRNELNKQILRCSFDSEILFSNIIKECNPLSTEDGRVYILHELKGILKNSQDGSLLKNVMSLIKIVQGSHHVHLSQINEIVIKICLEQNKIDQSVVIFNKFGWTKCGGAVAALEKLISQYVNEGFVENHIRAIAKACRNHSELIAFTQECLKKATKSPKYVDVIWMLMDEICKNAKNKSSAGSEESLRKLLIDLFELSRTLLKSPFEQENSSETNLSTEFLIKLIRVLNNINLQQSSGNVEICKSLIETYFTVEDNSEKLSLLPELLSCHLLFDNLHLINDLLISHTVQLLEQYIRCFTNKKGQHKHQQDLLLVHQILLFIFKKQNTQQQISSHLTLNSKVRSSVQQVLGSFLSTKLSIGGLQSAKIVDEVLAIKISIAYSLSVLTQRQFNQTYSGVSFSKLLSWALLNTASSGSASSKKAITSSKSCATTKFITLQNNIWNVIYHHIQEGDHQQVADCFVKVVDSLLGQIELINNRTIKVLYQQRIFESILGVLKNYQSDPTTINTTLTKILSTGKVFNRILAQISSIQVFESAQNANIAQTELVNTLLLIHEPQEKPKDWLLYKNGAKNVVYSIQYVKVGQNSSRKLTFQSKRPLTLNKIVIGFECDTTTVKNVCLPKEISLEVGESLENMTFVGKLSLIPDDFYMNFSVKIFGLNLNTSLINQSNQNLLAFAKKNREVKFLRLTIKPNDSISIFDALNIEQQSNIINQISACSQINFLSVQGYLPEQNAQIPDEIQPVIQSIEVLSSASYKEVIEKLFVEASTLESYQKSLVNMSLLMNQNESYSVTLHNFLMRVCEINDKIGDGMLDEYLQIKKNPILCSKISAEIVLASQKELSHRVMKYFNFIKSQMVVKEAVLTYSQNQNLIPFMERFSQILFIISKNQQISLQSNPNIDTIHLEITHQIVLSFTQKPHKTLTENKFIKTLLTADSPIRIQGFDSHLILKELYDSKAEEKLQLLASLVTGHKQSRIWFMEKQFLEETFEKTRKMIEVGTNIKEININLKFLGLISQNSNIKNIISKSQYDLKIFEMLVDKRYEKLISDEKNNELRNNLVNFIAQSSLGSGNQRIIGALLKDSLNSTMLQGNQKFVGQVFLPLLNSYSKATVCIIPYNSQEHKIITDLSNLKKSNNALKQSQQSIKIHPITTSTPKMRLASNILKDDQKEKLFTKIRELNTTYKSGVFNLLTNHGTYSPQNKLEIIEQKLFTGNNPILLLFKVKSSEGGQQHLGIFCNRQNTSPKKYKLEFTKGSFIMLFEENKEAIVINKVSSQSLIELEKQNLDISQSDDVQIQNYLMLKLNNDVFGEIAFGENYQTYLNLSLIKSNQNTLLQNNFEQDLIQAAEYWTFDINSESSSESTNNYNFTRDIIHQMSDFNYFKPEYLAHRALQLLRHQHIYEFPSSITIRDLKNSIEILSCRIYENKIPELELKISGVHEKLDDQVTLEQILKKKNDEDLVIDLILNVDKMVNCLDLSSASISSTRAAVQFLPKKGILKYFQENDGVKSMIKVIKKSIESWKNQVRREKWIQYVIELERFSAFPHFFSVYLKDKETFTLLFNLLSGLPDKETDIKWDQLESVSSQKLLKIVAQILQMDKSSDFRNYAMKNNFFDTILQRLRILTGIFKRKFEKDVVEEEENQSPSKNQVDDDGIKKVKKKKGVGYSADMNSNTKWMKGENMVNLKKQFEVIEIILTMIQNFLNIKHWIIPQALLDNIYQSALLPYIEDCLRAGTLLEISKHPEKFKIIMRIIRVMAKHEKLVACLLPLAINYQPGQSQSIESLLKSLQNTSKIFLSCLSKNNSTKEEKISEELANDIISTYGAVEQAIEDYKDSNNLDEGEQELKNALQLPMDKKYKALMKDLRFDYMDMKESPNKIKHHYSTSFTANYTPNQNKMIRLAQELADISTALPYEHTNGVYVRCDKDRVDFMQAMIMGSNGTPYGHGAFLFDIYFDDNYPNGPPKVNLTTTGHGKIRFNPNLYACGKVCLSLLGTWRGSASENWDAKVSTLLQVLLSIQAIIMSEEVYFNEPGFENQQGTEEGEKKNQAYSNIVRYGNVKFAMVENLKNPPKGFQSIVRRHFYIKKDQILEECKKWIKYAEKRAANYVGLVNDHNVSWATQFKKSKTQYKQMLEKAVKELEEQLQKLPVPQMSDIMAKNTQKKQRKKKQNKDLLQNLEKVIHEQIDVSYEKNNNKIVEGKQIDIHDEKVKDRWSRYIGAMGIDAVSKQSKADILVLGMAPFALQVIKNLVLSGCRKLTICDDKNISFEDLSGGFFYQEEDIGKKRLESILYKIRELNAYVKIDTISQEKLTPEVLKTYTIVLCTELQFQKQSKLNQICRDNNVKFVSADSNGVYCRLINDFGSKFEVLDKNGEQPVEVIIKDITNEQKGIVTLLDGVKHPFEDGEAVIIKNVEGMTSLEDKAKSINETIHIVKTINSKSFEIGNTTGYDKYIRNGTAKNIKTPLNLQYHPISQILNSPLDKLNVEANLEFYDFIKIENSKLVHCAYLTIQLFQSHEKRSPKAWNLKDAEIFFNLFQENAFKGQQLNEKIEKFIKLFSLTYQGYLPPLCAFFGGFVAQQIIKGITQKFKPVQSTFYMEFSEILPSIPENIKEWSQELFDQIYNSSNQKQTNNRNKGFSIVVGKDLVKVIKESKLFMIGAGAIGCQLLKNFAMIGLGTGEQGKITLTDPDHIENSNLSRQFLFREKHISKPKSRTAAASILLMNPELKNHISALLERISDSTKDIFNNKFFESLTIVANALDNVAARRYVDQRCVENKIPLFESGTLGPKGHVQVIIPYVTESYGSQNDPVEDGQIPHCTLKMFPEETLHCVEWARDIFGKKFSLQPKGLLKVLDKSYKPEKDDTKTLNESLVMVKKGPKNFDDCISYAIIKFYKYFRDDVMQLLYTYPLDAKTKNGEPFWKLPKRPPFPIKQFNAENSLHATFVAGLAVLLAKIYQIPFPKNFRTDKEKFAIAKEASKFKITEFVPSDEKAKAILKETIDEKQKKEKKEGQKIQEAVEEKIQEQKSEVEQKNEVELYKEVINLAGKQFGMKSQEFEKDDDSNGHIDFIYSMANLRAINYKLDAMDWITTKLKAGRIVPALATTTSCVAGLQTLQICKYLKKIKIDDMKSSFLNLAVPSLQMSEPGLVQKKKITEKLTVTLWDRWEVPCGENSTFKDLYEELKAKYEINPIGVLQGMSRIDTGKSQNEKNEFLSTKILDKLEKEDDVIDLIVLFAKSEQEDKIIEGIPPVRLVFKKK